MTHIFDAHNDLLAELAFRREEERAFERYWLSNLSVGSVKVQVCPVFSAQMPPGERLRWTMIQIAAFHRALADHPDRLQWIRSREDLDDVLTGDKIGMLLAMEGVEAFEDDLDALDLLWDLGVRVAGLTWNTCNRFASGGGDDVDNGLSSDGRDLVDRMLCRGMGIDLAHASPKTFDELIDLSWSRPPILSHSGCRAVFDTPRNASDDQLRALAKAGGVLGTMLLPLTVDLSNPTLDRVVDHVEHAAAIAGEKHVGIGSDFVAQIVRSGALGPMPKTSDWLPTNQKAANMEFDASVDGLDGPQHFTNLVAALERRGWTGERLDNLLLGNFARVLRRILPPRNPA